VIFIILEIMSLSMTTLLVSCLIIGSVANPTSDTVSVSIDKTAHAAVHSEKLSSHDKEAPSIVRKQSHAEPASVAEMEVEHDAKAQPKVQDDAHKEAKDSSPTSASSSFPFDSEEEEDIALDELETMTIWNAFSQKHPQDCVMSSWAPKCTSSNCDDCSKTCGGGECTQTRYAIKKKNANGLACPPDLTKDVKCNKDPCPTTTTTTAATTTMTTTAGALRMVQFTLMPFFCLWILVSQ